MSFYHTTWFLREPIWAVTWCYRHLRIEVQEFATACCVWWYRMRMVYWYWIEMDRDVPLQFCFGCAWAPGVEDLDMENTTPRENVQGDLECWNI